jgi:ADP-ribose pyrophosphatase YjhB (NUDIX family)
VSATVVRVAGRILLIDPRDRVLLINEAMRPDWPYWLTPGGGVEAGETPRLAAIREVFEETGIRLAGEQVCDVLRVQRRQWADASTTYDQTDHFFAARVPGGIEPVAAAPTPLERAALLGFAWWSADELRGASQRFFPSDIAELLDLGVRVLAGREHDAAQA